MSFARVYPEYIAKAQKKGRTKTEVDEIIRWLTGYTQEAFEAQLEKQTDIETFIAEAPQLNPSRTLIKWRILPRYPPLQHHGPGSSVTRSALAG